MSRIGDMPVGIPAGVEVNVDGKAVSVKGKLGESSIRLPGRITASVQESEIVVKRPDNTGESKSLHGLARSLIANMIHGVAEGYVKELEIVGVGFRATVAGQLVTLLIGYSSPVEFLAPEGVTVAVNDSTKLVVSGRDKQKVGQTAARLRAFFPAEPYKGKGIQYKGERVRRKVGKTVA